MGGNTPNLEDPLLVPGSPSLTTKALTSSAHFSGGRQWAAKATQTSEASGWGALRSDVSGDAILDHILPSLEQNPAAMGNTGYRIQFTAECSTLQSQRSLGNCLSRNSVTSLWAAMLHKVGSRCCDCYIKSEQMGPHVVA